MKMIHTKTEKKLKGVFSFKYQYNFPIVRTFRFINLLNPAFWKRTFIEKRKLRRECKRIFKKIDCCIEDKYLNKIKTDFLSILLDEFEDSNIINGRYDIVLKNVSEKKGVDNLEESFRKLVDFFVDYKEDESKEFSIYNFAVEYELKEDNDGLDRMILLALLIYLHLYKEESEETLLHHFGHLIDSVKIFAKAFESKLDFEIIKKT